MDSLEEIYTPRKALIITALPLELEAVLEHLENKCEDIRSRTVFTKGKYFYGRWDVFTTVIGERNANAETETYRAIKEINPEVVIFVGVAGGVKDVNVGDVVAANYVYDTEGGKVLEDRTLLNRLLALFGKNQDDFKPRIRLEESSYGLIQRASVESIKSDWKKRIKGVPSDSVKVIVKPIASSSKVIATKNCLYLRLLKNHYSDAIATEMEGYGFLCGARKASRDKNCVVEALVIRGISDLCGKKDLADAQGGQIVASKNASAFAFEILAKFTSISKRNKGTQETLTDISKIPYKQPSDYTDHDYIERTAKKANQDSMWDDL